MTDSDEALARRYRELSREEPRAALDEAILAASRRAVAKPSASRRWAAPLSIAAVLVLAFGLTLEMQHEKPDVASPVDEAPRAPAESPSSPAPSQPASAADVSAPAARPEASSAPAPALQPKKAISAQPERKAKPAAPTVDETSAARSGEKRAASVREPAPFPATRANTTAVTADAPPSAPAAAASPEAPTAPPPAALAAPSPSLERSAPAERAGDAYAPPAGAAAQSAARMAPRMKAESADAAAPSAKTSDIDRELERIAKLRSEGRDAEADKALADFRSDHPGYRIPEAMWERVRRR